MLRKLFLWASQSTWLRERIPRFGLAQRAVSRFMPGETLGAALEAADGLGRQGLPTVLTNLGENVTDLAEASAVTCHYSEAMERVAGLGVDCEISLKLTHLGLDLGQEAAYGNLLSVLETACGFESYVWTDMEGSEYTDVTVDLVRRAGADHDNLGVCLQSYLYRTGDDLDVLLPLGCGIRLVKGAYDEPSSIAYPNKRDVDGNYLELSRRLLDGRSAHGSRIAFATHDERLIDRICAEAGSNGTGPEAFEFQMLYGIRPDLQRRLAAAGYRVRVLISYGEAWFPWYMRRLAERPANVLFVARSMIPRG